MRNLPLKDIERVRIKDIPDNPRLQPFMQRDDFFRKADAIIFYDKLKFLTLLAEFLFQASSEEKAI
jgi:hypothetical protein